MPLRKMNLVLLAHGQMRRGSGVVLAMALLATSPVLASPVPPRADAEASPHGIAPARPSKVLRGDFEQARVAQARYDIPKLLLLARDCRDLALKLRKRQPEKGCDAVMFRAAQRLGDARTMVEADYWWQRHGLSATDKTSKLYLAFQQADLTRLVDTVPAFSARIVDSPSTLAYQHRIEFSGRVAEQPLTWHRPTVTAIINGKPVAVLVDTGTVVPLVMDQTHATVLGAIPLMSGWVEPGVARSPPAGTKGFTEALITRFEFGGLLLHNVAAMVVPDGTFHVGVLVGLPVLARFGRVSLSDTQITLGAAARQCANSIPLRFVGGGQLGFSTTADGRPVTAFVDTGDENALVIRPKPESGSSGATDLGRSMRRTAVEARRQLRIQLGSWSIMQIDTLNASRPMGAGHALPAGVGVNIGAPLLAFADVQFDFSKPSLCVSPKPAVKNGAVFVLRDWREESFAKNPIGTLLDLLDRALAVFLSPGGVMPSRPRSKLSAPDAPACASVSDARGVRSSSACAVRAASGASVRAGRAARPVTRTGTGGTPR